MLIMMIRQTLGEDACAIMHITNAKEIKVKTIGFIPLAFGDDLIFHLIDDALFMLLVIGKP